MIYPPFVVFFETEYPFAIFTCFLVLNRKYAFHSAVNRILFFFYRRGLFRFFLYLGQFSRDCFVSLDNHSIGKPDSSSSVRIYPPG